MAIQTPYFTTQPAELLMGRGIFATEKLYLSQTRVISLWSALWEVQRCLLAAPQSSELMGFLPPSPHPPLATGIP